MTKDQRLSAGRFGKFADAGRLTLLRVRANAVGLATAWRSSGTNGQRWQQWHEWRHARRTFIVAENSIAGFGGQHVPIVPSHYSHRINEIWMNTSRCKQYHVAIFLEFCILSLISFNLTVLTHVACCIWLFRIMTCNN